MKPSGCESRAAEFSQQPRASLAWERGNPFLRSVDSEPMSHAIEPRKRVRGSCGRSRTRSRVRRDVKASLARFLRGRRSMCVAVKRVSRELGRSCPLHGIYLRQLGGRVQQTPRPCGVRRSPHGSKATGATVVPPSEGIRSAAGWMAGSLSVRAVPMKPGQPRSIATRRREGGRLNMEPAPGPTPDASTFKSVSTQR